MNLNTIHLEVIKGPTISCMIIGLLLLLIIIGFFGYVAIEALNQKNKVLGIFFLIIAIILSLSTINATPKAIEKYKTGDVYKVYLNDKKDAKEITKENYDFIKNIKEKAIFGDKPTKDEANKIKSIILKY